MMTEQNPEQEAASNDNPWPHLATLFKPKSKKDKLHVQVFTVPPEKYYDLHLQLLLYPTQAH